MTPPQDTVVLAPRFWVPLGVVLLGLGLLPLQLQWQPALWISLVISLFGLFLLVQTTLLRLVFSAEALDVQRQGTVLRRFPYSEWISWRVFWPTVPVLFYFREQKSIHLLPMLFDAAALRQQLETRLSASGAPAPSSPDEP